MLSFKDRLELLEADLKKDPLGFIVSSDLPYAIFRYNPNDPHEREFELRGEIQRLIVRVQSTTPRTIHIVSLGELFWNAIKKVDENILADLMEFEQAHGFIDVEEQLNVFLSDIDYYPLPGEILQLVEQNGWQADRDVIFLMRAGVFAPSIYRVSSLLEQLMNKLKIPTILFYPGTWQGSLNFLGLHPDNQPQGTYRAKIYGGSS